MARTGASFSHASSDYVIAFSTAREARISHSSSAGLRQVPRYRNDRISPLFQAVAEATEEAVYNSLVRATTLKGRGGNAGRALPMEEVEQVLKRHGRGTR